MGDEVGLDHAFLQYIGVTPEGQRQIQRFYLPFFQRCRRVVDLGCGEGDFVAMLVEQGIAAIGVDRDPESCAGARSRGLDVICQDVFTYLEGLPQESIDGIFSAHLVEHLHYEEVLRLLRLAHRALKPGGCIVLTTPNVCGLFAHLEMFYLHFGHVSFYHPRLLCFFLEYTGFRAPEMGENPQSPSLCWKDLRPPAISYQRRLPTRYGGLWGALVGRVKGFLAELIVWPYLDQLVPQVNAGLSQIVEAMAQVDRPFEAYVMARKG
ncbi:MAG: class I SAM-dependent methyltransferase [Anaerolineae bacterium]